MSKSPTEKQVERIFPIDTANHKLTILHDQGLYRHLYLSNPECGIAWYEIVTWPGSLTIKGDMGGYTFSRVDDMFKFFRGGAWKGEPNPIYWSEKTTGGTRACMEYSEDHLREAVVSDFVNAVQAGYAPRGLGKAIRAEILDEDLSHEDTARQIVDAFQFKKFRFEDFYEHNCREFFYWFLWNCHAIILGINSYDNANVRQEAKA
jgi:hypothetical protein